MNIAQRLAQAARRSPDKAAVIPAWAPRRAVTFGQLDRDADLLAAGFRAVGVADGCRTILMVRPSPEFFALVFALFRAGAVPVLVDPGMGRASLVDCLARTKADAFIGIPLAHLLRTMHRRRLPARVRVVVGGAWPGCLTLAALRRAGARGVAGLASAPDRSPAAGPAPGDLAAILFTTGSTGPPKGVEYTHATFGAQVRALEETYGFGPDEIDLPTFPLFALFDAALGITAVLPRMDYTRPGTVDPAAILGVARRWNVTTMFGSPALLRRVAGAGPAAGRFPDSLRRVITAGAPVAPDILKSFAALLPPGAEIHTPYGATEALPVADIGHREILEDTAARTAAGEGVCVGRVVAGVEVAIMEIDDGPVARFDDALRLPTGAIGEIAARGDRVTQGYFGDGAATALHKMRDTRGTDGPRWHRMGDIGRFDDAGRLWMLGRKGHRVSAAGGDLFTEPVEARLAAHSGGRRVALVALGARPAQTPAALVECARKPTSADDAAVSAVRDFAAATHGLNAIRHVVAYPGPFPVDIRHNAKIFREKLAVWAAARSAEGGLP